VADGKKESGPAMRCGPAWASVVLTIVVIGVTGWQTLHLAAHQVTDNAAVASFNEARFEDAAKFFAMDDAPRYRAAAAQVYLVGYRRAVAMHDVEAQAKYERGIVKLLDSFAAQHTHRAQLARTEAQISVDLAMSTGQTGWADRAIAAVERWTKLDPFSASSHLLAGDIAWQLNRTDLARRWYARAVKLNEQAYLDPDAQLPPDDLARAAERASRDELPVAAP
jgi:Tfp pilus assembly protein PilF